MPRSTALWIGICLTVFLCGMVALGLYGPGSVIGTSQYLSRPADGSAVLFTLLLAGGVAIATWLLLRLQSGYRTLFLALVFGIGVQFLIHGMAPMPLTVALTDPGAHSFYSAADQYTTRDILGSYPEIREDLPHHAKRNLPGKILFMQTLDRVLPSARWIAVAIVVLSALGGLLVYRLARLLGAGQTAALTALLLYAFLPTRIGFLPLLNTISPLFPLALLVLTMELLRRPRAATAALLGVAGYLALLFEPLPLVVAGIGAALVIERVNRRDIPLPVVVRGLGSAVLSFLMTALVVRIGTHFDIVEALRYTWADAATFNARHRVYSIWVGQNLLDFFITAGLPISVLFAAGVVQAFRQRLASRGTAPVAVFTIALMSTILLFDIAGMNRGETPRLWIFLAALMTIPAAQTLSRIPGVGLRSATVALLVAQSALMATSIKFI